jgi:hypothetical protein
MPLTIRRVDYFYTTIKDQPGEAYKALALLADLGVNLLALTAVPIGPMVTQLTVFPDDSARLADAAKSAGLKLDGPHRAFLVLGEDRIGALADVHAKLYNANVNVYASSGVTDGKGSFGYVIYIRPEHYEKAAQALSL